MFEITKPFIFVEIPYCELNEIKSEHFLNKFHNFTNSSFRIRMVVTWKTRNIQSLFPLKDKNNYKSCFIYKGVCSCVSRYTGETKCNAEVRLNEQIQLKVQIHQNTFEVTSTTVLCGLSFQMLQKMLRPESIIYCSLET